MHKQGKKKNSFINPHWQAGVWPCAGKQGFSTYRSCWEDKMLPPWTSLFLPFPKLLLLSTMNGTVTGYGMLLQSAGISNHSCVHSQPPTHPTGFWGPGQTETKPHHSANTVQSSRVSGVLPELFYPQMQSTAPAAVPGRPSAGVSLCHKTLPHPGVLPATACIGFTGKVSSWKPARKKSKSAALQQINSWEGRGKHHHLRRYGERDGQGPWNDFTTGTPTVDFIFSSFCACSRLIPFLKNSTMLLALGISWLVSTK